MVILGQIKELQRGDLVDIDGQGAGDVLPAGPFRSVTGTFGSVADDTTEVICHDFTATILNTGTSANTSYTAAPTL